MGRHSCCYKQKLRKGLWSPDEDEKLLRHITEHGHGCWSSVPKLTGLQRCGKSCRLRWINYLRPDLKRGALTQEEEDLVIELHAKLGNRWSQIAAQLPGRTDNEIKNQWNSLIKKKLLMNGIDPNTHKPISKVRNEVTATNSAQQTFEEQGAVISMKATPPPVEFDGLFGDLTSSKIDQLSYHTLSNTQEFLPGKSKGLNDVPDINCAASNSTDYFSFQVQQFSHGSSPTFFADSNLFGRQKIGPFELGQEMNLKTLLSAQNEYKSSSTSILSESVYTPNGRSYWETRNSGNCSSISSSKSSESQNRPVYDVNNLPWGFTDDSGSSDRAPSLHPLDDCEVAYMKWPEYLNIPLQTADDTDGYSTLPSFTNDKPQDGD